MECISANTVSDRTCAADMLFTHFHCFAYFSKILVYKHILLLLCWFLKATCVVKLKVNVFSRTAREAVVTESKPESRLKFSE